MPILWGPCLPRASRAGRPSICVSLAASHPVSWPSPYFPSYTGPAPLGLPLPSGSGVNPRPQLSRRRGPRLLPPSLPAAPSAHIYSHLICVSGQPPIYLQVLISFRLIEVQAHGASLFDPQIGYESQLNRLIFAHGFYPELEAVGKSMKSTNDSRFIEHLPF